MSFPDLRLTNSRERVTNTDLNTLQTLLGAELANILMYFLHNHNAFNELTFATGRAEGVLGGLGITTTAGLPAPIVTIEPGMILQWDDTDVVTPRTDADRGTVSSYRLGRLDSGDTRVFPLGMPPLAGQSHTIQVRHKTIETEEQSRDVWDVLANAFTPEDVFKRIRPGLDIQVLTGAAGDTTPPVASAGWIAIATIWSIPTAFKITDVRPFLAPRMMGHPAVGGLGTEASICNSIAILDTTQGLPTFGVVPPDMRSFGVKLTGFFDASGTGAGLGLKGLYMAAANSGFFLYDYNNTRWVAKIMQVTGKGCEISLYDEQGDTRLNLYQKADGRHVLELVDRSSATQFHHVSSIGDINSIFRAGVIELGGSTELNQRVEINGGNRRMRIKDPVGVTNGYAMYGLLNGTEQDIGGWLCTYTGSANDRPLFGYVTTYLSDITDGVITAGEPVVIRPSGFSTIGVVRRAKTGVDIITADIGGSLHFIGDAQAGATHDEPIFGIAINTCTLSGYVCYVCTFGECMAICEDTGCSPGDKLMASTNNDGRLMKSGYAGSAGSVQLGHVATVIKPQEAGGVGTTFLYKVHFHGGRS